MKKNPSYTPVARGIEGSLVRHTARAKEDFSMKYIRSELTADCTALSLFFFSFFLASLVYTIEGDYISLFVYIWYTSIYICIYTAIYLYIYSNISAKPFFFVVVSRTHCLSRSEKQNLPSMKLKRKRISLLHSTSQSCLHRVCRSMWVALPSPTVPT